MRIRVNFNMSAHPHIIYFPLVWIDVAEMIADDFQKKVPGTCITQSLMCSARVSLEQLEGSRS